MIRIKICGVTTPDDAAAVSALGADAIGLNFIRASKRFIGTNRASAIMSALPSSTIAVGLFDGEDSGQVENPPWQISNTLGMPILQLYNWQHAHRFAPTRYFKPFQVRDRGDLDWIHRDLEAAELAGDDRPAAVIIDSHSATALGGTGHVAPWHLLAGFDPGVPVILAGGLTPDNVAEAIRIVRPYGVDVASGVESSPGVKDPFKVRDFIAAAREALAAL